MLIIYDEKRMNAITITEIAKKELLPPVIIK
jgi:hypothetical protein